MGMRRTRSARQRTNHRRASGFTLVEALVAIAVFGIGVAALTPMIVSQVRANNAAAIRTRAVALAQEKLEVFRALPFDDDLSDPNKDIVDLQDDSESIDFYTREWVVEDAPGPPADSDDIKRITVRVSWDLPRRTTGEVTFVTARARY